VGTTVITTLANPTMTKALTARTGVDLRELITVQTYESGTATVLDFTSATWTLKVAEEPGETAVLSKTTTSLWTTSGVKVIDADAGQIAIVLVASDIATLTAGQSYRYQVTATMPAANADLPNMVWAVVEGILNVVQAL
jgi:hypothetical protein